MKQSLGIASLSLLATLGLHGIAQAGILGNLGKVSDYFTQYKQDQFYYTGAFQPVVVNRKNRTIKRFGGNCTTTIVHASKKYGIWGLTSAHCAYNKDGNIFNAGRVVFTMDNQNYDVQRTLIVKSIVIHKGWIAPYKKDPRTVPVSVDFALLRLAIPGKGKDPKEIPPWIKNSRKPIPDIQATIDRELEVIADFGGVGGRGDGKDGISRKYDTYGRLMGGQNYVTSNDRYLGYDLDDSTNFLTDTDGSPAVDLEFLPYKGDSGSPILYRTKIIGIHKGRDEGIVYPPENTPCPPRSKPSGDSFFKTCTFNSTGFGARGVGIRSDVFVGWVDSVIQGDPAAQSQSLTIAKGQVVTYVANELEDYNSDTDLQEEKVEVAKGSEVEIFNTVPDNYSTTFDPTLHQELQRLNQETTGTTTANPIPNS